MKEMSEAGRQFSEIYEEHHDPEKREERKLKAHREQRAKQIKEDAGT